MKYQFILAAVLSFISFGSFAQAREFYKADSTYDLSKTSADAGTVDMPGKFAAVFIWSDDGAYCTVKTSDAAYPCKISVNQYDRNARVLLSKEFFLKVLLSLGAPTNIFDILASFTFSDSPYHIDAENSFGYRVQLDPIDPSYSYHLNIGISPSKKL